MSTQRKYERDLHEALKCELAAFAFVEHDHLSFIRVDCDRVEIMNFGGRMEGAAFLFTLSIGIRFTKIEAVRRPDDDDLSIPTIMAPIHLLRQGSEYQEWLINDVVDAPIVAQNAIPEITALAERFFKSYPDVSSVKIRLQSPRPRDWFVLSSEQRIEILASIAKIEGRAEEGIQLLDAALLERRDARPALRASLERLRERILHVDRLR
jgi:hypothetical protein